MRHRLCPPKGHTIRRGPHVYLIAWHHSNVVSFLPHLPPCPNCSTTSTYSWQVGTHEAAMSGCIGLQSSYTLEPSNGLLRYPDRDYRAATAAESRQCPGTMRSFTICRLELDSPLGSSALMPSLTGCIPQSPHEKVCLISAATACADISFSRSPSVLLRQALRERKGLSWGRL
jgi:hypothetical protein